MWFIRYIVYRRRWRKNFHRVWCVCVSKCTLNHCEKLFCLFTITLYYWVFQSRDTGTSSLDKIAKECYSNLGLFYVGLSNSILKNHELKNIRHNTRKLVTLFFWGNLATRGAPILFWLDNFIKTQQVFLETPGISMLFCAKWHVIFFS